MKLLFWLSIFAVLLIAGCSSAPKQACMNYDRFNNRYMPCGNYGGVAW